MQEREEQRNSRPGCCLDAVVAVAADETAVVVGRSDRLAVDGSRDLESGSDWQAAMVHHSFQHLDPVHSRMDGGREQRRVRTVGWVLSVHAVNHGSQHARGAIGEDGPFLELERHSSGVLNTSSVPVSFAGSFASRGSRELLVTLTRVNAFSITLTRGSLILDSISVSGNSCNSIVILGPFAASCSPSFSCSSCHRILSSDWTR